MKQKQNAENRRHVDRPKEPRLNPGIDRSIPGSIGWGGLLAGGEQSHPENEATSTVMTSLLSHILVLTHMFARCKKENTCDFA